MRPFYRKDLFRNEIVTSNPIEYQTKINSDELQFETLKMEKGQSISLNSEHYEIGVVILQGTANIQAGDFRAEQIGKRKDVFSGKPTMVYIPCETRFSIKAVGYGVLEIALCKGRATQKGKPYIIQPEQVVEKVQGVLNWKRKVHEIIVGENQLISSRLIIGETYGCPGTWSVYPYTEEDGKTIFHFKIDSNPGKRLQVMRSIDKPQAYYIQEDTTLLVQESYIPVPEVEKSNIYYLWFKLDK